jgi:hypothetical protein
MNSGTGLIAPLVQSFFTDHLVRRIEVKRGFDAETLRRLVVELERA